MAVGCAHLEKWLRCSGRQEIQRQPSAWNICGTRFAKCKGFPFSVHILKPGSLRKPRSRSRRFAQPIRESSEIIRNRLERPRNEEAALFFHRHSGSKIAVIRIGREYGRFMRRVRITVEEFRKNDWQRFSPKGSASGSGECESAFASLRAN